MKKEFKIGLFAVIIIVVSFFLLNYLRGEDIFNRESEYVASFDNIEGLVASAPVYIKGYKAGKVSEVNYDRESEQFNVICSVSKEFKVPEDSRIVIYSVDIMGGKGVKIDLGSSNMTAADGDTLATSFESGLIDGLSAKIVPLMDKVGKTIDSLGVTVSGVNRVLSGPNTVKIGNTLDYVESLMSHLRSLSASIDGKSDDITALISNLKVFSDGLESILEKVDTTVGGVEQTVASVNSADLSGTINSLKALVDNINDPSGTIGKLFVDDSVYDSVDSLLINIDRLIDKIEENPKKYLKISVF